MALSVWLLVGYALWNIWPYLRIRILRSAFDNIPGPKSPSFFSGHIGKLASADHGKEFHDSLAKTYGPVCKLNTYFGASGLYIFDPKTVHYVLVKNQASFEEPESVVEGHRLMIGNGLFTVHGERHRIQRKLLNPVFSAAHLREMTDIFYEVTRRLEATLLKKVSEGPQEIDFLGWASRLALELIGQSGLGYSFDTLEESAKPHAYGEAVKKLSPTTDIAALFGFLIPLTMHVGTRRFRRFLVEITPISGLQEMREISDKLHETAAEIFNLKKKALEDGDEAWTTQLARGKDIISISFKANQSTDENEKLTDEELTGQINSFTFAATDTTSSALSRIIHLLALHPERQTRLREELRSARHKCGSDNLDYDLLSGLPYLDAVCRETLRLFPPLAAISRNATEDNVLPLSSAIKGVDGRLISEIPILKGQRIYISIWASNRNPELWGPDAEEWKPERWLEPLPDALTNARIPGVYSHLLTFSGESKSCIGFKFSQLEMKVVLAVLLAQFEFKPSKPITWKMTAITTPWNMESNESGPSLPIIISRAA